MDDLLELLVRLLDPIVHYLGPHAVAAFAILGALTTYYNAKKQRRREKRFESKLDLIIERIGATWNAESAASRDYTAQNSLLYSWLMKSLARLVESFIACLVIVYLTLSRRVERMSTINWFGITSALLGAAKIILQSQGIDVIDDNQINAIANGVAALMTIVGIIMSNRKKGAVIGERVNYSKADDVDA